MAAAAMELAVELIFSFRLMLADEDTIILRKFEASVSEDTNEEAKELDEEAWVTLAADEQLDLLLAIETALPPVLMTLTEPLSDLSARMGAVSSVGVSEAPDGELEDSAGRSRGAVSAGVAADAPTLFEVGAPVPLTAATTEAALALAGITGLALASAIW